MEPRTVKTDEYTIESGYLNVGDGHNVWFEQWGKPDAEIPILVFHGGPGGEYKTKHKYDFDPRRHQLIGFDQRGSGNSLPYGEVDHNTTSDLIQDAAKILSHLGVNKVHIIGGSWGSTLALLFAIAHPDKVETITIRGVFLATQKEIDWVDKGIFRRHYPEVWQRFIQTVPMTAQDNPAAYHYQALESCDETKVEAASKALRDLEFPLLIYDWRGFEPAIKKAPDPNGNDIFDPVPYKIYGHYMKNACFLEPDYIENNIDKVAAPLYIVQGRYDMCCPPAAAYDLHKAATGSKLYVTLSSHSNDPETNTAMKIIRDFIY